MDLQSIKAISGPLNEGIVSICNICKSLLDTHVDPNTDMCSSYKQIRQHIEHAEECLKKSEKIIKEKLECLDKQMEQLTKQKTKFEQQNKEKCMAMDKLCIEKKSAEESLQHSKAALEQAKKVVALRKEEIKKEMGRKKTGDDVTIAGAALLAVPILGWIAGPIMLAEGERVSGDASRAIRDAENELKENESEVFCKGRNVSSYQNKISSIENEIKETDKVLKTIQREIEVMKQNLENTSHIQEMVRKAVNLLSVLRGRVTVVERQTQRFILWGPVIKCMEDVMKAAGNVADNRLLYRQGVPDFINALREKVGGVLALCNSRTQNSEYDSYY